MSKVFIYRRARRVDFLLRQNLRFLPDAYLHPGLERHTAGPFPLH